MLKDGAVHVPVGAPRLSPSSTASGLGQIVAIWCAMRLGASACCNAPGISAEKERAKHRKHVTFHSIALRLGHSIRIPRGWTWGSGVEKKRIIFVAFCTHHANKRAHIVKLLSRVPPAAWQTTGRVLSLSQQLKTHFHLTISIHIDVVCGAHTSSFFLDEYMKGDLGSMHHTTVKGLIVYEYRKAAKLISFTAGLYGSSTIWWISARNLIRISCFLSTHRMWGTSSRLPRGGAALAHLLASWSPIAAATVTRAEGKVLRNADGAEDRTVLKYAFNHLVCVRVRTPEH